MDWYRTGDYSAMITEIREEYIDLYIDDDEKPSEQLKEQLAFSIQMIVLANEDKRLKNMISDALLAQEKEEIREIIISLREILKEPKFNSWHA